MFLRHVINCMNHVRFEIVGFKKLVFKHAVS